MTEIVIATNVVISLLNLYIAWKIWRVRQIIAKFTNTLVQVERKTHQVLYLAPELIIKSRQGTRNLRESHQELEQRWRQIEQVLKLLALVSPLLQSRLPKIIIKPRHQVRF